MPASRTAAQAEEEAARLQAALVPPAPAADDAADVRDLSRLLETPQAQKLISEAAAAAAAAMLAQMQARTGQQPQSDLTAFANAIALQIATLTDQTRPEPLRTVPPEIMEARRVARERMVQRLLDAKARGLTPEYDVINFTYLGDELVEPFPPNAKLFMGEHFHIAGQRNEKTYRRQRIGWSGVPNEALKPANPVAEDIMTDFLASIGGGREVQPDPLGAELKRLDEDGSGLKVMQRDAPPSVRVLGTIAEPARGQW